MSNPKRRREKLKHKYSTHNLLAKMGLKSRINKENLDLEKQELDNEEKVNSWSSNRTKKLDRP